MIGIGIGIPLTRGGVSAPTLGTTMATTHYNRVIADGGVLPAGISGLGSVLDSVIAAYGVTDSTDFNTKVPVFLDPQYTGYKLGAGSGTTLGQAAQKVYAISSSADVTQTTAASQPLLLAHSGVNYWWGSGVNANFCSSPHATINNIRDDIEIIVKANCAWNGSTNISFYSKDGGGGRQVYFYKNASNGLSCYFNVSAFTNYDSTTTLGLSSGTDAWVKVTRQSSTGDIKFYKSTDGTTYTQVGSTVSGASGQMITSTAQLEIGSNFGGANACLAKIYRTTISNSIGGDYVVDCNPNEYVASTSQTSWTSNLGEVWTINTGTATTGYKGVLVDRTILQGDAIDDRLTNAVSIISYTSQFSIFSSAKSYLTAFAQYPSIFGQGVDGSGRKCVMFNSKKFSTLDQRLSTDIYMPSGIETPIDPSLNMLFFASFRVNNWSTHRTDGLTKVNKNSSALAVSAYAVDNPLSPLDNTGFAIFGLTTGSASLLNGLINTFIFSNSYDSDTKNTSMYNIISSMNNNAF